MGTLSFFTKLTSMRTFIMFLKVILVLNLIDAIATYYWVHHEFATEANPFMRQWIYMGPHAFILFKIALVSAGVCSLWVFREHILSRVLCIPVFILYLMVFFMHCAFGVSTMSGVTL